MKTPRLKTALVSLALSVVFLAGAAYGQTYPEGLVLWNKLGSQTEVENSEAGLDGTFLGGGFAAGMFGSAFVADYTQDSLVRFPKEVIPVYEGCIEFWARLIDFPHALGWGVFPMFAYIQDPAVGEGYAMQLNGNDGTGDGGLCAWAGRGHGTGTGSWSYSWTYEQVLGSGQVEEWHHYALVWDENGIPGVADGTKKIALFLDGQLNSGIWYTMPPDDFVPLTSGEFVLIWNRLSQGSVAIDNLKIWDYPKTNFSDRFVEGFPPIEDCTNAEMDDFESYPLGTNPTDVYDYLWLPIWSPPAPQEPDRFEVGLIDGNQVLQYHFSGPVIHFPGTGKLLKREFRELQEAGVTFLRTQHSPGFGALTFAWQDIDNYYDIRMHWTNTVLIQKKESGTSEFIGSLPLWSDKHILEINPGARIEVRREGDTLIASITRLDTGAKKTLEVVDTDFIGGRVGFNFYEDWGGGLYVNVDDLWVSGVVGVACWVGDVTTADEDLILVPVDLSDVNGLGVYSAEVVVNYDPDILTPTGFNTTGTLIDNLGWMSGWSELEPGRSKVSMGGVTQLEGEGTLVTFTFEIAGGAPCKGCTDLELEVLLNEGDPCVEVTDGGECCLPVETVSGTALYYACPELGNSNPGIPYADFVVVKYGVPPDSLGEAGMTDSLGQYSYPGCVDTCYKVTLQKAPGETVGISSLDASLVLQYTLDQESLSVCPIYPMLMPDSSTWCPEDTVYAQQVAAEVSGDGTISAYDASLILKYVVGLDGAHCGGWKFYCDHRDYCPLDESWEDQDYVGVVIGDVSGDWQPGGGYGPGEPAGHDLTVSDVTGVEGELASVPVHLNLGEEIISLQFRILHDPGLLTVESVGLTGIVSDWQMAFNPLPGETRVALAGVEPIAESGEILLIEYRVTTDPGVWQCDLEPGDIVADEGGVVIEGDGGVFLLEGASVRDDHAVDVFFSKVNPNPVRGGVEIVLGLPVESTVKISVYDASGRLVRRLVGDEVMSSGERAISWDRASEHGHLVSPGLYFLKVEIGAYRKTHRVVIVE